MLGMELSGPLAFLRRPFSLAGRRNLSDRVELDIIHRIVGIGTDWMSHLKVGDHVDILGPLGNQFTVPAAGQKAILVGGGVGIPPMLYLAEALAGMDAAVFCGALSRDLLPMTLLHNSSGHTPSSSVAEFTKYGVASTITTNDGSFGFHGLVTVALEKHLDDLGFTKCDTGAVKPNSPILYCCGPEPMMKRVADIAKERRLESQIAIERAMACGMGTCQSCCIKLIRDPARDGQAFAGKDWIYKLACTDGPVFKGADLLW